MDITTAPKEILMKRRRSPWIGIAITSAIVFVASGRLPAQKVIRNHTDWTDVQGKHISCHDGGIARVGDTFYWYGTSYEGNPQGIWGRRAAHLQKGFNVYSSKNLVDWKHEGVCLEFPKTGRLATGTSHRPNVLRCDRTGKYVMWFFLIGEVEPEYPAAMLTVAIAEKPEGPFQVLGQRGPGKSTGGARTSVSSGMTTGRGSSSTTMVIGISGWTSSPTTSRRAPGRPPSP